MKRGAGIPGCSPGRRHWHVPHAEATRDSASCLREGRVRSMRTQWPRLVILGSAVALVTAVSACSSSPLRLVTSDSSALSGMEALLRGTLAVDGDGCVQAKTAGDPVTLVWPQGYTVRGDSKSFEVLDGSKNVVASSGSSLAIGGGASDSFQDTWTERACAKGRLWMVGGVERN